jgi:hypothetical protein
MQLLLVVEVQFEQLLCQNLKKSGDVFEGPGVCTEVYGFEVLEDGVGVGCEEGTVEDQGLETGTAGLAHLAWLRRVEDQLQVEGGREQRETQLEVRRGRMQEQHQHRCQLRVVVTSSVDRGGRTALYLLFHRVII